MCSEGYVPTPLGYDFTVGLNRWGQSVVDYGLSQPARVGHVSINAQPIFNTTIPEENKALYRLANRLHTNTKLDVLQRIVLFKPGTLVDDDVLAESERLLRGQRFIADAVIRVVGRCQGVVDLEIITREVWTLVPEFKLGTSGGESTQGIGFQDSNFLGGGNRASVSYASEPDRNQFKVRYLANNLGDSRLSLAINFEQNSDGYLNEMVVEKPFYSLKTPTAWGATISRAKRAELLYAGAESEGKIDIQRRDLDFWIGRAHSQREKTLQTRYGLGYEEVNYASEDYSLALTIPESRHLVYPYIELSQIENDWGIAYNINQIGRKEDLHFGRSLRSRVGYAPAGESRLIIDGSASDTWQSRNKQLLQAALAWHGRWNSGANVAEDVGASFVLDYHRGQTDKRSLYMGLKVAHTINRSIENQLFLGGSTGLRGYPAKYLSGDTRYLFTAEERLFTDYNPFRLFHVGLVAFFDAGKVSSHDNTAPGDGWRTNIGLGLRLAPDKSDRGRVLHIDLGYPLQRTETVYGPQLLVEIKQTL